MNEILSLLNKMYIPSWQGLGYSELFRKDHGEPLPFPLNIKDAPYFYLAREGIYHLFRTKQINGNDTVLVPAYHHGNEISAIIAAGWKVRYYSINRRLQLDLEELKDLVDEQTKAIMVIHYMGWPQPIAQVQEFCREHDLLLIEDCALSLLSSIDQQPLGSFGDFGIFCLYKTLPVPNGGLIVQRENNYQNFSQVKLRRPERISTIGRTIELIMERIRLNTNAVGKILFGVKSKIGALLNAMQIKRTAVGDTGFDVSKVDLKISPISHIILSKLDYTGIRRQRRKNFEYLRKRLEGKVTSLFSDLPTGVCPLFYPIVVSDKSEAAMMLRQRGIGVVEFWNQGHPSEDSQSFGDVQFLRTHVLELPIHQDLQEMHLDYVVKQVLDLGELIDIEW